MSEQLILPILQSRTMDFNNYCAGENINIVESLKSALELNKGAVYYLFGAKGTGKTHLLKASFNTQIWSKASASYFSLDLDNFIENVDSIDPAGLVCIDNLDYVTVNRNLEEPLFHLYNQVLENKGILIFAARKSPKHVNILLPDLVSRLSWGLVYNLKELSEDNISIVLHNFAFDMGLELPIDVVKFLLTRCSRNINDLLSILGVLNKAAYSEKRKLTIPFVKMVLNI
ncbi:MAG: DnaA regulatory inactivator Hda [Legionellales bacterium]|nr:DnaA regulatory inactivator Hda [Legionellales bacterium]